MADLEFPLPDDPKFILGQIHSTVQSLPARMDRFEQEMRVNLTEVQRRIGTLEIASAHRVGVLSTVHVFMTAIAAVVASLFSGLITWFIHK